MHKYHFISKGVAPKREALRIAQEDLAETQRILDSAKKRLKEVEQGVALLQTKYNDCVRKKQDLETNTKLCEARLVRADKVCIVYDCLYHTLCFLRLDEHECSTHLFVVLCFVLNYLELVNFLLQPFSILSFLVLTEVKLIILSNSLKCN